MAAVVEWEGEGEGEGEGEFDSTSEESNKDDDYECPFEVDSDDHAVPVEELEDWCRQKMGASDSTSAERSDDDDSC